MRGPADYTLQIPMQTVLGGDAAAAPVSISGKAENWQGSCGIVHRVSYLGVGGFLSTLIFFFFWLGLAALILLTSLLIHLDLRYYSRDSLHCDIEWSD